jgi:hypothetical protein
VSRTKREREAPSGLSDATPRKAGRDPDAIGLQSMVAPPPRDAAGKGFYANHDMVLARVAALKAMGFGWVTLNATAIFQAGRAPSMPSPTSWPGSTTASAPRWAEPALLQNPQVMALSSALCSAVATIFIQRGLHRSNFYAGFWINIVVGVIGLWSLVLLLVPFADYNWLPCRTSSSREWWAPAGRAPLPRRRHPQGGRVGRLRRQQPGAPHLERAGHPPPRASG